jgi:alkylation response protein AidB-like acyl-CoA dehydrogenase
LKLALMNEILGRSRWAPTIFGCQAPDSGNAEILAHFGSPAQKDRFLRPLLAGEISSTRRAATTSNRYSAAIAAPPPSPARTFG